MSLFFLNIFTGISFCCKAFHIHMRFTMNTYQDEETSREKEL